MGLLARVAVTDIFYSEGMRLCHVALSTPFAVYQSNIYPGNFRKWKTSGDGIMLNVEQLLPL